MLRLLNWDAETFEAHQSFGFPKALGRSFSGVGWDIRHMKYSRSGIQRWRDQIIAMGRALGSVR